MVSLKQVQKLILDSGKLKKHVK